MVCVWRRGRKAYLHHTWKGGEGAVNVCVCVCVCECVRQEHLLKRLESMLDDEVGVRERSSSL